jgi:hypothetical protein
LPVRLAGRLATFPESIEQCGNGNFCVSVHADCNPREPSECIRPKAPVAADALKGVKFCIAQLLKSIVRAFKLAEFQVGRRFTAIFPSPHRKYITDLPRPSNRSKSHYSVGKYRNDVKAARQSSSIQLFCGSAC